MKENNNNNRSNNNNNQLFIVIDNIYILQQNFASVFDPFVGQGAQCIAQGHTWYGGRARSLPGRQRDANKKN